MRVQITSAADMHEFGVRLGRMLVAGDLVILTGPLGAGKTTLTRGIGEGLDVRGPITSPTFVLARTHPSLSGGAPLVHVDAYRVASAVELDDLDIDVDHSVVVAEWGAGKFVNTHDGWLELVIERPSGEVTAELSDDEGADEPRLITLVTHGDRWVRDARLGELGEFGEAGAR